jgi:dienelactone hydrolase
VVRRPNALLLALVLILLAGCGGSDGGGREATGSATTAGRTTTAAVEDDPYAYDASEPVRLRDLGRANDRSQLQVRDVVFAGAGGNAVTGYLLTPPGKGPFPAVVYLHGAGGSRADFVGIASWIVARGAVALAIDSPFVREQPQGTGIDGLRSERDLAVRGVVDARRAVDALQTLPQVDDDRIGLVGFSAGARSAAILAGVEPRFRTVVLWSGGVEPVSAYTERLPTDLRLQAGSLLSDVDPLRFVDDAKAPLLFQAGRRDEVVPRPALERLYAAAAEPKELRWYPAGHQLNAKAYADHLDWLTKHLEVDGPVIPGLETAPS